MARSSSGRAKPDGMRRRSSDAKPKYLSPRKRGNRLREELMKGYSPKSGQNYRKRG